MRDAEAPAAIVVVDGDEKTQRRSARRAVRRLDRVLATRRSRIEVVAVGSVPPDPRALVGRRLARRVTVRHLVSDAARAPRGARMRPVRLDPATVEALRGASRTDVSHVPSVAAGRPGRVAQEVTSSGTVHAFGVGDRVLVRDRRDARGRTYQRDFLGPDGAVRYVCWVDRELGQTSHLLVLDGGTGEVRRRSMPGWTARALTARADSVPVVAASATGDAVVDLLPSPWRDRAVPSGASVAALRAAVSPRGSG